MKLLLTADLHLGRSPTRLPATWQEEARTVNAWRRLVDAALEEEVDALLICGDVVDSSNKFWEAVGPLEEEIRRLAQAEIPLVLSAGNHDADVLPQLLQRLPKDQVILLGAQGRWQRHTLQRHGQELLHLYGWSFPSTQYPEDPTLLAQPDFPDDGLPRLGMLHGDPDAKQSSYAPYLKQRLRDMPLDGWLLGHIHAPSLEDGPPWLLMPGSPQPLDPGEPGPHSAWTWCPGELPQPICPARQHYQRWDLTLQEDQAPSPSELLGLIQQARTEESLSGRISLRLRIHGTVRDPQQLQESLQGLQGQEIENLYIEEIENLTQIPLDLEQAQQSGPLARHLANALQELPEELKSQLDQLRHDLTELRVFEGLPALNDSAPLLRQQMERLLRQVTTESKGAS